MNENENETLERDDEIIREHAMTSGEQNCSRWKLRPTCAPEISWMQFNGVIMDSNGMDVIWRTSAFTYIHSAPKAEVRKVVRNKDSFIGAVDVWMEQNDPKSTEVKQLSGVLSERMDDWFSSSSETGGPSASLGN